MDATSRLRGLLKRTALLGCVLMVAIVVTSAFLRLKTIGIGCDVWPQCYARVIAAEPAAPSSLTAVGVARLLHRICAMAVALLAAFVLMVSATRAARDATNLSVAIGLCLLTALLAVVGRQSAGTLVPLVGLVNLLGGFAMLTMFWLLWLHNHRVEARAPARPGHWLLRAVSVLIVIQVAMGALVSVTYSAFTCSGILECATRLDAIPAALMALDPAQPLALDSANRVLAPEGAAQLQLLHRVAGFALGGLLVLLGAWLARHCARPRLAIALAACAAAELLLGVIMVVGEFPLPAALLHNVTAALLLVLCVSLAGQVRTRASA